MQTKSEKKALLDGSRIIVEALVNAGADAYISYPITPANMLNAYAEKRFEEFIFAPDEITVSQWAAGFSAAGKIPVTATSFPGFALMVETFNMLYMMELPIVIVLAQRLGPSTGSATVNADGDIALLNGCISGGYNFPVLTISSLYDCWDVTHKAVETAKKLRTPVVLLTSKEMIMTTRTVDLNRFTEYQKTEMKYFVGDSDYRPYRADDDLIPPFLSVMNNKHQVRFNSSTHDEMGEIKKSSPDVLGNTMRISQKMEKHLDSYFMCELNDSGSDEMLMVSYGITNYAVKDAVEELITKGKKVSHLTLKTLLPVSEKIYSILDNYKKILFVEENYTGQMAGILYGKRLPQNVKTLNKIGNLISPVEIVNEVEKWK